MQYPVVLKILLSIHATVLQHVCEINRTSVNPHTETELCRYCNILKLPLEFLQSRKCSVFNQLIKIELNSVQYEKINA